MGVTAGGCFSKKVQENQGLREFEGEFIFQIYDRKWGSRTVVWRKKEEEFAFCDNSFF